MKLFVITRKIFGKQIVKKRIITNGHIYQSETASPTDQLTKGL